MPRLENAEIAAIFAEMADLTHIVGGNEHRIRSFRRAARVIESLPENAETMIKYGTFERVPGVGEGTLRRTKQILLTGTCDDHRELRRQLPSGLRELLEVVGIWASTARRLWQHLKISSIDDLDLALRSGAVARLPRMGQRTAEKLMQSLVDYRQRRGRVPYVESLRIGSRMVSQLDGTPDVAKVALAGSVRRGKALIGDLDVLVGSDDAGRVAARFVTLPDVQDVLLRGEGRCQVRLGNGQQCDLRVIPPESFGAGMHYFTGSQLHNIAVRARALRVSGLKISDKGVFVRDTETMVHPGLREEDVFAAAKLPYIPPEIRENTGEIEAAEHGRLPRLVERSDLKGDLHMHTLASDGRGTAEQMVDAALALGHSYIAITDHTQSLEVANGLDERRLLAQAHHLEDLEQRVGRLRILRGTEVDILADGSLDIDLEVLQRLDWVIASVHSAFDMTGEHMTERLISAMETGVVDCIGHPTGRRLDQRTGSELDYDRLFQAARRCGVAVEVNGNPYRMDLPDVGCRRAKEMGVPIALNTDAHAPGHLARQEYGLVTARRGWLEPDDVLNTRPWTVLADLRADRFRSRSWVVPDRTWQPQVPIAEELLATAPPVAVDHWPDEDRTVATTDTADELAARLAARPVDAALANRLGNWLQSGQDPPLEEALRRLGEPMQVAFGLVLEARASLPAEG
jgi:DNA polymerase (family 10)